MKVRIILPVCLFLAGLFFAPRCAEAHETVMMTEKSDSVYLVVDELPTFPGGDEKLMLYIAQNLHYPAEMRSQEKSGRLFVNFVVSPSRDSSLTVSEVVYRIKNQETKLRGHFKVEYGVPFKMDFGMITINKNPYF